MARIAGINIPNHQHAEIALTAIYGIGRARALAICAAAGVERNRKIKDLNDSDLDRLREQIARFSVEGDLRREGCGLSRPLETGVTGRSPRKSIALTVSNGDDRVVERRMNVGDALGHILTHLLARACRCLLHLLLIGISCCHKCVVR